MISDAVDGVEYAFKKAASVVTFGLVDDPDNDVQYPSGIQSGPSGYNQGLSVTGLNYSKELLEKPNVNPDDSTVLMAQSYQQEDDYLRRSNPVVKPAAPKDDISPETLMLAGGLLAAAVLLSE